MSNNNIYDKSFPVSWEELHRNSKALAWRLSEMKPYKGIIAVTRGGLVPAAIVARELGINACVGTINGTELLSNIQEVTLDCSNGTFGNIYEGKLNFSLTDMKINTDKKVPVKLMLNIVK